MQLKINKKVEVKFFEVSYSDGNVKFIYVAKNKKQVKDAEYESCELDDLDFIKELSASEVNRKIKISKKDSSLKKQAIKDLELEGINLPKQIASRGLQ